MKKKDELIEMIYETVEENLLNKNLQKSLKSEYIKKGLGLNVTNLLWGGNLELENLSVDQLIGICKVFYNALKDNRFKLGEYFSDGELFSYSLLDGKSKQVDSIVFENVIKIDNKNYMGYITGEQIAMLMENNLIGYYKQFQRTSKIVKTSRGKFISKLDINTKNIAEMIEKSVNNNITITSVHFGIIVENMGKNGLKDGFKFIPIENNPNVGKVIIKPNYDTSDENYFPFLSVDGYHRLLSYFKGYKKALSEGKEFNSKLGFYINIFSSASECLRFISDTFRRSDTNAEFLNAIEETNENKYVSKLISNSKLNGHVALTNAEIQLSKNWIKKDDIVNLFKHKNISMSDNINDAIELEKIISIINDVIAYNNKESYSKEQIIKVLEFAIDNANNSRYKLMIKDIGV